MRSVARIGSFWDVEKRVIHRGLVSNPDTLVTAGTDEYIGQIRYNAGSGIVRLGLQSTYNPGIVNQAFALLLMSRNALTVVRALNGTDAGEDVGINDSGTNRVEIFSTLSGDPGRWEIDNETKSVDFTITGNADGARCIVAFWGGSIGSPVTDSIMDALYWGQSELDSQIDVLGMPALYEVWLSPQITDGMVNDIAAGKVTESATLGFIHPSYTDASRRPNVLRKAGGDLAVANVFDKSADSTDAITESATKKFAAESGADVTSAHQAATIAGQGALATKNDFDGVPDGSSFKKVTAVNGSNQITTSSIASEAVGNAKISTTDPVQRSRIDDNAVVGRHFDEQVVDEYQNMGSGLSDGQWDNLEV